MSVAVISVGSYDIGIEIERVPSPKAILARWPYEMFGLPCWVEMSVDIRGSRHGDLGRVLVKEE